MKHLAILSGTALAATLAACVPQPKAAPPVAARPTPAPTPAPPPPPAYANWMDAPRTPGDWRYAAAGRRTQAIFSNGDGAVRFAMTCDQTTRVTELSRAAEVSGPTSMTIRTESTSRNLNAVPQSDPRPELVARVPASDRLLDAMALSKGRFAVEVAGTPALYLPSWAEVTRVIEDCR